MTIKNVHVDSIEANRTRGSISWETNEARYHVWVKLPSLQIEGSFGRKSQTGGTLYKNPPLNVERGQPGHYNPKYLDASVRKNAEMIEQAMTTVNRDGLVAKAIKAQDAADAARVEEIKQQARDRKIESAAPEMFKALTLIRDSDAFSGGTTVRELQGIARDALRGIK